MARIIIAAHREAELPEDPVYLPVLVGAALHTEEEVLPPYERDDSGDQISEKNPLYCELTGLYYAWKNLREETLGMVHYRRYFAGKKTKHSREGKEGDGFSRVLTGAELDEILADHDIILPKKQNYVIESIYSHYAHTHDAEHLDLTRQIIAEGYPEYLASFDRVMKRRSAHMFNMTVMKEPYLSAYCTWLFDILAELEERFSLLEESAFQRRYVGRVGEILINVWLDEMLQSGRLGEERIAVLPVIFYGKVNWVKKGSAFLQAKFLHKRYEESF